MGEKKRLIFAQALPSGIDYVVTWIPAPKSSSCLISIMALEERLSSQDCLLWYISIRVLWQNHCFSFVQPVSLLLTKKLSHFLGLNLAVDFKYCVAITDHAHYAHSKLSRRAFNQIHQILAVLCSSLALFWVFCCWCFVFFFFPQLKSPECFAVMLLGNCLPAYKQRCHIISICPSD